MFKVRSHCKLGPNIDEWFLESADEFLLTSVTSPFTYNTSKVSFQLSLPISILEGSTLILFNIGLTFLTYIVGA